MYFEIYKNKGIVLFRNALMVSVLLGIGTLITWGIAQTVIFEWV